MKIIKINDAINKAKLELDEKINKTGLNEEQVNYLFAVATARCGYKIESLLINADVYHNQLTLAGDMVDQTKRSAIRNILSDVCGIEIMDDCGKYKDILYYVHDILREKLKLYEYNNILQHYDEAYIVIKREEIYIIAIDEYGIIDSVEIINNEFAIFRAIRLNEEQIEQNKELVNAIDNIKSYMN